MDRISCDIICDLLPLYCDDVISQDGRALVEEHLGSCPACADMLERMKTECRVPGDKERAREAVVKGMASEWGRSVKKSFAQGAGGAVRHGGKREARVKDRRQDHGGRKVLSDCETGAACGEKRRGGALDGGFFARAKRCDTGGGYRSDYGDLLRG